MFEEELSDLTRKNLLRNLRLTEPSGGVRARVDGREVILMCSNDYLGLAGHPALGAAACAAMDRYGFGSGASRLISGTSRLHIELEERIAEFKGTGSAILFNSGYAANTGIIPAAASEGDVILSDSLNHASIIDGCRLSRARTLVYRHRDVDHAEDLLKESAAARRRLIVTDGVFSMDGDIAPLRDLTDLAERYNAILMVDDAHGTGVMGDGGRGTAQHFGLEGRIHIQMGTFGKAFGVFGAYAAGDMGLIQYLINKSRSFIFSTSLPPAVCAAAMAAIDIVKSEPERRNRLWRNRERFVQGLSSCGISAGPSETPIIPIIIGSSENALRAAEKILEQGIYAPAVRPPTVPEGSARIRITVTAAHSDGDIDRALEAFGGLKRKGYLDAGQ